MKNKRDKYLKMVKALYFGMDMFFILILILSIVFFKMTNVNFLSVFIFDLCIIVVLAMINYEVHISGFEKIANAELTRNVLSCEKFTKVIPVEPPDELKNSSLGTYNTLYGNLHNALVNSQDVSECYAKISTYGELVQISKKYFNEPGLHFVGSIKLEYFPYFYELDKD